MISDDHWFGIRAAARSERWAEVERRAHALGSEDIAALARKAGNDRRAMRALFRALLLDREDAPDPFGPDGAYRGLTDAEVLEMGYRPTSRGWIPSNEGHRA